MLKTSNQDLKNDRNLSTNPTDSSGQKRKSRIQTPLNIVTYLERDLATAYEHSAYSKIIKKVKRRKTFRERKNECLVTVCDDRFLTNIDVQPYRYAHLRLPEQDIDMMINSTEDIVSIRPQTDPTNINSENIKNIKIK